MRRTLVAKNTAYPQKVVQIDNIQNPKALNEVGGLIKVTGQTADDIRKVFQVTQPAQMSTDVEKLQQDLINTSRALAGASDATTGDVQPDQASGKAILAVQNASKLPLVEQLSNLKRFIEAIARIWLDMIIVYNPNGLKLEEEVEDPVTKEKYIQLVEIEPSVLEELKASVKVDITPKGTYDKYAQELSLENLLKEGFFSPQKLGELKLYVKALPDDSTMPKQILQELIDEQEKEQEKIAQIQSQAQQMMQRASAFINSDVDTQVQQLVEARGEPINSGQSY